MVLTVPQTYESTTVLVPTISMSGLSHIWATLAELQIKTHDRSPYARLQTGPGSLLYHAANYLTSFQVSAASAATAPVSSGHVLVPNLVRQFILQ